MQQGELQAACLPHHSACQAPQELVSSASSTMAATSDQF